MNDFGLFSSLAKYAPQPLRSAEENFSTELLAYALRSVPEFRKGFLASLAKLTTATIPEGDGWTIFTQRPIVLGPKARKYPDIQLEGPGDFTLLVEVKVESPVTLSAGEDGSYVPQLELYRKWLEGRGPQARGMLFILSKYECDGAEHCSGRIRWSDVARLIDATLRALPPTQSVERFFLIEMSRFLKEQGMIPSPITKASLDVIREFRAVNSSLRGLVGELNSRWSGQFRLIRSRGAKITDSAEGYIIGGPYTSSKHELRMGLWFAEGDIIPLLTVRYDGLEKPAQGRLLKLLGVYCSSVEEETWWNHSYALYGKSPAGFTNMSADRQVEALGKEGDILLQDVLKL
jgi:hypothetical protein